MAEGATDKTEKPTARRIQQAREEGQVAKSVDFNSALVLGAATMVMMMMGGYLYTNLNTIMVGSIQRLAEFGKMPMTIPGISDLIQSMITSILLILFPVLLSVTVIGILSNLIQVKPLFAMKAIQPKFDKINPLNGFKRLWSMRSIVELLKGLIKLGLVGWVAYSIVNNHMQVLVGSISSARSAADIQIVSGYILNVIQDIALWSVACFFVIGILDWRYQAYMLEKQLRMSKQDIKDEHKSQEGDPMIKSRIRQMGIKFAKKRQLVQVPTADVVITNPTHFAIAIKYDPDIAPAPMVVAKGADHFALKIKEVAKEHGVPMIENKPLARSLYKIVEVEQMIPPELFVAVAEVMAFVFSKNKGRTLKRKKKSPLSDTTGGQA